ncbi:hypothetical protein [Microbacterium luteum]|uniref:hypothetical protein n=1 Tax=Microbacterium luteum TaxID=2782167 RepID=UPI001886AB7B|nr:hypothetical protein [Microbacterium luteum]
MATTTCAHWVGNDTTGHRCNAADIRSERLPFCEKHYKIQLARAEKQLAKERARHARTEADWFARNAHWLPAWRRQLEQAEAEYERRTAAPIADRAAVGGAMHGSIVRSQRSHLSDTNVSRVVELQSIIAKLRADIARAEGNAA